MCVFSAEVPSLHKYVMSCLLTILPPDHPQLFLNLAEVSLKGSKKKHGKLALNLEYIPCYNIIVIFNGRSIKLI